MIKKLTLALFIGLVLVGCSSKNIIQKDKLHEESLIYTQKGEIVSSLETKSIIFATYLNKLSQKFNSDNNDSFLIGTYISNDFDKEEKKGLNNPFYTLTDANSTKPILIKKLDKDDEIIKHIPTVNVWSSYFLVTFKANKDQNIIKLIYTNTDYGKCELVFSKED